MDTFDTVVIGSGVGGTVVAYTLQAGGKRVALIENDLWGGTCPNRGCDPKKVLLSSVEALDRVSQLDGRGIESTSTVNWSALMAFKRTFTDPFPQSFERKARQSGIDTIYGTARFTGPQHVDVDGRSLEADTFVIATGQHPSMLDIEGSEYLKSSSDFLDMEEMPPSITFIGAGYIAFELASIACSAGSAVTIIHHNDQPLKAFDEALVKDLVGELQEKGVRFVFSTDIKRISKTSGGFLLEGTAYTSETACVICATGRTPTIDDLNLEAADVAYTSHGIDVDEHLRTTNAAIFACGDAVAKAEPKLTPTASFEGAYVANVILGTEPAPLQYPPVASIVFSSPKLASIGVTADTAHKEPSRYSVSSIDMTEWFTYRRTHDPISKVTLVHEGDTLVGASTLSSHADELINYLAILIHHKSTRSDLEQMILGSPTLASDLPYLL